MGLKLLSRVLPWALFTPVNRITLEYTVLGPKIPTFWGKAPILRRSSTFGFIWLITVRLPKGKLDLNSKKIFQQILTLHLRERILYCIVYTMCVFGDFLVDEIYTNKPLYAYWESGWNKKRLCSGQVGNCKSLLATSIQGSVRISQFQAWVPPWSLSQKLIFVHERFIVETVTNVTFRPGSEW